jgi:alpha-tubulin suppressor-like RCC1 family protein
MLLALAVLALAVSTASGERASQPSNVQAGYLDAGSFHTCARISGGAVRCWGLGSNGQLGYGSTLTIGDNEVPSSAGPVNLGTGRTATQVGAGENRSCALMDNAQVRCWGSGGFGGLGYGSTEDVGAGGSSPAVASRGPINFGAGHTVKAISIGNQGNCAILDDDTLKCWGQAGDGVLGYGNETTIGDNETPAAVGPVDLNNSGPNTAKAVSTSSAHTCAILTDNTVRCWGLNTKGALGYGVPATTAQTLSLGDESGETPASLGPVDLVPGSNDVALAIAAGGEPSDISGEFTCAILGAPPATSGPVKCWGTGFQGRLGTGNTNNIGDDTGETPADFDPINLGIGRTAKAITVGAGHACAILDDGSVRCWGSGFRGRTGHGNELDIGDGSDEMPGTAVSLGAGRKAVAISAGNFHVCARLDDNSVICWGRADDNNGYLGYGNSNNIGDSEPASAGGPVSLGSAAPPDRDKDGKPDSKDACPTVPGTAANGCPAVARSLTLGYSSGAYRGKLSSPKQGCVTGSTVVVWKRVGTIGGGDDKLVGSDAVSSTGAYVVTKARRAGSYYARAGARTVATAGNCAAAQSALLNLK